MARGRFIKKMFSAATAAPRLVSAATKKDGLQNYSFSNTDGIMTNYKESLRGTAIAGGTAFVGSQASKAIKADDTLKLQGGQGAGGAFDLKRFTGNAGNYLKGNGILDDLLNRGVDSANKALGKITVPTVPVSVNDESKDVQKLLTYAGIGSLALILIFKLIK